MPRIWKFSVLLVLTIVTACCAESIDDNEIDHFCYPDGYKNTRKSCECSNESAPPWGMRALRIDCSYKDLKTQDVSEVLPLYADTLDLSWNTLEKLPVFVADSLRLLNMMHNNITTVSSGNFARMPSLREIYLSWNSIQVVEMNAFSELSHLKVLDLSHNNLQALSAQIFAPLLVLETLNLSWNRQINQTVGIQELDFYHSFGINTRLRTLRLESCSLANVVLPEKAPLMELYLRRNLLKRIPQQLPHNLTKLDVSDNLLDALLPADTAALRQLKELYLEDMPHLATIEENAFVPLVSLESISFQNSRHLGSFNAYAFGPNSTQLPPLRSMIFRGTAFRTFNATLAPVFHQLTILDLNGMPLHCDCDLIWVKQLPFETNGRCFKPARLRGMLLTNARLADFSCDSWPRWVYGLIILGLIILCTAGIYFIVVGLRPNRNVTMRRKVGAGSPYARVTIEPNRQESNYY